MTPFRRRRPADSERFAYGPDPSQFGDLHRPAGPVRPATVVLIHGGFWRARYRSDIMADVAVALAGEGWTTWRIEYRRVGAGGGYPQTLEDVGAAVDHVTNLPDRPEGPVVTVGHSAGGHLAVWAAGRPDAVVPVGAAVSLAGVLDLGGAATEGIGGGAASDFMGGLPAEIPDAYDRADPLRRLPLRLPVRALHSQSDRNVPFTQSRRYVEAARGVGDDSLLTEVTGDHFSLVQPRSEVWAHVLTAIEAVSE